MAHDVDPREYVLGQPAIKASDAKRVFAITQKLPDLKQRVKALETELAEIRDSIASAAVD